MADYKAPAQVDDAGKGVWVYLPVAQIVADGATFKTGNPGAMVEARVENFPGVGVVNVGATVRLKQPKAAAQRASADPAVVAAAVIALLEKRGVKLEQLVPAAGQPVHVAPGTTGSELAAGKAAVATLAMFGATATGDQGATVNGDALPATVAQVPGPVPATVPQDKGDGDQQPVPATVDALLAMAQEQGDAAADLTAQADQS